MRGHNKQDFSGLNYTMISLLSDKINILIVGGGEAALIKCKTFSKEGCNITVVSKEFCLEFYTLQNIYNLKLIKGEYDERYVDQNHIVIIATDNIETNDGIKEYCDRKSKLYVHCGDYKQGLFVTPVQRSTPNMKFALHTKNGSPKTTLFMSKVIEDKICEYEGFINYTCSMRNMVKKSEVKKEIMNFVCSEDFYFFYNKGVQNTILEMFYGAEFGIVEN
ncbi:NAD(P)-dependent oxidoreductase [Clostridium sp. CM028]|uniref:NAD(P)-dependent oxidoreductase n=1 Tax=unclassified Clostridium TaxID=2614128 RepID=UPI001C6E0299|nr:MULTISPECIES: NAD(P)-dependent oxidoreductase [unclassified Clostridium]MBW9144567.1 NAD(P)-dependent oxidoreductase [Clostridium sp. CM027]MBW9147907.1 NAD(P)-dependent oxidoreductase [Clostridium sp. CM028]UVE40670.1 NAD(P)-dependent oxidoreductase [Clostridium sp. CM027]WLC61341.1 NAD(P)-dependent oxidoreductase [Clostridium sp. CM028]